MLAWLDFGERDLVEGLQLLQLWAVHSACASLWLHNRLSVDSSVSFRCHTRVLIALVKSIRLSGSEL